MSILMAAKLKDLHSLFVHELKDLYSAEHQLTKALPKMAKASTNTDPCRHQAVLSAFAADRRAAPVGCRT
jgi:hypothetical protein